MTVPNKTHKPGVFTLDIDGVDGRPWEVIGWSYKCKAQFKDGRSAEARSAVSNPSDDGRKQALCEAWSSLYHTCLAIGIPYMSQTGGCAYGFVELEYFESEGPSQIKVPRGDDLL